MAWHVWAWHGMNGLVKEFEDTYEGAHELQGFWPGRAGAKNRGWTGAKNRDWPEHGWVKSQRPGWGKKQRLGWGLRPEAGLDRGLRLGWTEARGWAGQRPEVGLDRGQKLGWTEAERRLDIGQAELKKERLFLGKKQRPGWGKK
jgi:hypothetical protein